MGGFDGFIEALAPEKREPDRLFVTRVQAQIRLEEKLAASRRALAYRLAVEVTGIAAIAAGLLILAESPAIAEFAIKTPEIIVATLLAAFAFVVAVFSAAGGELRFRASATDSWK